MNMLNVTYLNMFVFLYALIDNQAARYATVFIIIGLSLWLIWKWISKLEKTKNKGEIVLKVILIIVAVFLIGFQAWFILIHLQTLGTKAVPSAPPSITSEYPE